MGKADELVPDVAIEEQTRQRCGYLRGVALPPEFWRDRVAQLELAGGCKQRKTGTADEAAVFVAHKLQLGDAKLPVFVNPARHPRGCFFMRPGFAVA